MSPLSVFAFVALLVSPSLGVYTLRRNHAGDNFTNAFEFRTVSHLKKLPPGNPKTNPTTLKAADYADSHGDPTGGFVNYVSEANARSKGLVKVTNGQVYLGADATARVSSSAQGRDSVRLEAKEAFTYGLLVADIAHMPGSICGSWPAL